MRRPSLALNLALLAVLSASPLAAADLALPTFAQPATPNPGRFTAILENDALQASPTDYHYTQGARLSYLTPRLERGGPWDGLFDAISDPSRSTRRIEAIVGQSLFTPRNLRLNPPDPTDRPYAGWLYGGVAFLQEVDGHKLHNFEVLAGVVGPSALGRETQTGFHEILGQIVPRGWGFQVRDEPAFVVSYDRKWRYGTEIGGGLTAQVIPEVGVSVGNVLTYAQAGALVRVGQNLEADYGPARIRPSLSGTSWFEPGRLRGEFGWYLFAGVQGRAVARNIFLDGSTPFYGLSITKEPLVADVTGGASVFWADLVKVDFQMTLRTEEFRGQREPDRFGGITVSFRIP